MIVHNGLYFSTFTMKIKFKKLFIIILLSFTSFTILNANERNTELNKLFKDLKIKKAPLSLEIEEKIWKIWSTHPYDQKLTLMLSRGLELMNKEKFDQAIDIFTKMLILN